MDIKAPDSDLITQISADCKVLIKDAAQKYKVAFSGIDEFSFRNWITRNYLLANTFDDRGFRPFSDNYALIEIGPGLGAVLTLANLSEPRAVYSYDTFQMQEIFSAVQNKSEEDFLKLQKIPINSPESAEILTLVEKETNLIAFWSFTELKENERARYLDLIRNAKHVLIATNEYFEGINNFDYLEQMARKLNKDIHFKSLSEIFGDNLPSYQKNHRVYLIRKK